MNIIVLFLGLFALAIIASIHEFGHFVMAKKFNIKVCEFSIGIGPKIISFFRKGTLYSLRIIPFLAYIKLEENKKEIEQKNIKSRFFLYSGGILFNLISGIIIFIIIGMNFGFVKDKLIVEKVYKQDNVNIVKFKKNDQLLFVNNNKLKNISQFINIIDSNKNNNINFKIKRNNKIINLNINKKFKENKIEILFKKEKLNILDSIKYSLKITFNMIIEIFKNIFSMIMGKKQIEITGPIGILNITNNFIKNINDYLLFLAILNISVASFNLLPIFILDGGKILLLIFEKLRKKQLNEKTEFYLNNISFIFLIILLIYATFKDIILFLKK